MIFSEALLEPKFEERKKQKIIDLRRGKLLKYAEIFQFRTTEFDVSFVAPDFCGASGTTVIKKTLL